MNVVFFVNQFSERGTEVAIYDYAKYNEEILSNKSYIMCLDTTIHEVIENPKKHLSYERFRSRFPIIIINNLYDIREFILQRNIHFFHYLMSGNGTGPAIFYVNDKDIWGKCKTIFHCVFDTRFKMGDYHITISNSLNKKHDTNIPVIPHIVYLPDTDENLKHELNIPEGVIVFGRYGGFDQFDVEMAHEAIKDVLYIKTDVYFIFMNTRPFYEHPRIIYLNANLDLSYKSKFINTCDAMIHARSDGETFGLSIAEFSIKNKPIITCPCGDVEHILILGDKSIQYRSKEELLQIFINIKDNITQTTDWNAYRIYSPANVMKIFDEMIFSKYEN